MDNIIFGLSLTELTIAVLIVWVLWMMTKKVVKLTVIVLILIVVWFVVRPYLSGLM